MKLIFLIKTLITFCKVLAESNNSTTNLHKLNETENHFRAITCGTSSISTPTAPDRMPFPKNSWLTFVNALTTEDPRYRIDYSTGSLISSRHVLTSSQTVMKLSKWISGYPVKREQCDKQDIRILRVPENELTKLRISFEQCARRDKNCDTSREVESAVIFFNNCTDEKDSLFKPMIVTLKEPVLNITPICIADENTLVSIYDHVYMYAIQTGLFNPGADFDYRFHRVTQLTEEYIETDPFDSPNNRGGPVVKKIDGQDVVVAITNFQEQRWRLFDNMKHYSSLLCEYIGICWVYIEKPTSPGPLRGRRLTKLPIEYLLELYPPQLTSTTEETPDVPLKLIDDYEYEIKEPSMEGWEDTIDKNNGNNGWKRKEFISFVVIWSIFYKVF